MRERRCTVIEFSANQVPGACHSGSSQPSSSIRLVNATRASSPRGAGPLKSCNKNFNLYNRFNK